MSPMKIGSPKHRRESVELKLRKRKEVAATRLAYLSLPAVNDNRQNVSVYYKGSVIERPFRRMDSLKDVFDWVCSEVEDLPPNFSLNCGTGKEGDEEHDETLTNFDEVFFSLL
ncbi:uncharacterized protein LOC144433006 [Glandiceps talaboti]